MRPKSSCNEAETSSIKRIDLVNRNNSPGKNNFFSQKQFVTNLLMKRNSEDVDFTPAKKPLQNYSKSPLLKNKYLVPSNKPSTSQTNSQTDIKKNKTFNNINSNSLTTKKTITNPSNINNHSQSSNDQEDIIQRILEKNRNVNTQKPPHQRQQSKVLLMESNSNSESFQSKSKFDVNQQFIKQQLNQMKNNSSLQQKILNKQHQKSNSNPPILSQASFLLQKIKDPQKPQIQQLLQFHQELIEKQYQKLVELQQQHINKTKDKKMTEELHRKMKGQRSISTPDIVTPKNYVKSIAVQSQPGKLHTKQTKTNQDSYAIVEKFAKKANQIYIQVSDGHGINGHQVAAFIKEKLPQFVEQQFNQYYIPKELADSKSDNILNTIFKMSFERANKELFYSGIDITFSGATTVAILVIDNVLWCSNIGDSRAIIGRNHNNKIETIELSFDHKPDLPTEFRRILQKGGRVQAYSDEDGNPVGPARVWMRDENIPGLAMSRSFGDYVASQVGVISIPEIVKHILDPNDKFIIIASDGIWEFLTNEYVIKVVNDFYLKDDPEGACHKLVVDATHAWEREDEVIDDITCVVVFLQKNI